MREYPLEQLFIILSLNDLANVLYDGPIKDMLHGVNTCDGGNEYVYICIQLGNLVNLWFRI